jgi:hypothetical protein
LFITSLAREQDGGRVAGTLLSCDTEHTGLEAHVFGA